MNNVLAELEHRMGAVLREGDYKPVDRGEVRWRNAARWERQDMVDDGLLLPMEQAGIWQLSPRGRATAID
jgi:hypothetical protein